MFDFGFGQVPVLSVAGFDGNDRAAAMMVSSQGGSQYAMAMRWYCQTISTDMKLFSFSRRGFVAAEETVKY